MQSPTPVATQTFPTIDITARQGVMTMSISDLSYDETAVLPPSLAPNRKRRIDAEGIESRSAPGDSSPCWEARARESEREVQRLQRAVDELNEFAYIASHDLRAPMHGIEQLAEWIEEDLSEGSSEETRDSLRMMRNRISRVNHMLADLLEFSRAGQVQGESRSVEIGELCRELRDEVPGLDVFHLTLGDDLPVFDLPPNALHGILRHVLANCVKHHDARTGHVHIECAIDDERCLITVSDDGPGIPEQHHERVFRVFETLKRKDESEGNGIGLALVRRLAHSLGGNVAIAPNRGPRGCAVALSLPIGVVSG